MRNSFVREVIRLMLTSNEGMSVIRNELIRRFKSEETYYCLRRELSIPFDAPKARIPITIRPLEENDISKLLDIKEAGINTTSIKDRLRRLRFLKENVPTCYVAVTEEGFPCYMQWLLGAESNNEIQYYFNGGFPVLKQDEMLLEYAFTHENYRGKRIMSSAMAQIAEQGLDKGANSVISFVEVENIPSLIGCKSAGFNPVSIRKDKWRLFRVERKVESLPGPLPFPFD